VKKDHDFAKSSLSSVFCS